MDLKIENKIVLITGAAQGIGLMTAKKLCEEGAHVIINGRDEEKLQKAILDIKSEIPNANIKAVEANLKDVAGCDKLTSDVPHVDILINNLGIFEPRNFEDITNDEWLHMFNVNVMSGARLSQYYLPKMLKNNWGRIIFISSESALNIPKEMIHYGMTKSAQVSIARGVAQLTEGTSVTSNSIIVGPTKSEGVMTFLNELAKQENKTFEEIEKEFFEVHRPTSLVKKFAEIEESANMIVYIASSLSSMTNGAMLRADGGIINSAFS